VARNKSLTATRQQLWDFASLAFITVTSPICALSGPDIGFENRDYLHCHKVWRGN